MTTSINGKSIQYSKLKCLKYIGLTEGYGTGIYQMILLMTVKHLQSKFPNTISRKCQNTRVEFSDKTLHLNPNILQHDQKRGIYIGLTSKNSCKYIAEKLKDQNWQPDLLQSISNIFQQWLEKYAIKDLII